MPSLRGGATALLHGCGLKARKGLANKGELIQLDSMDGRTETYKEEERRGNATERRTKESKGE